MPQEPRSVVSVDLRHKLRRAAVELHEDGLLGQRRSKVLRPSEAVTYNLCGHGISGAALEILGAIPRRADRDLVFGIGAGGYGGWSSAKARLDKVVNLKTPWRVHDLRRTVRTGLGALGVLRHVSEAVLNHKEDKLIRTYDRNPYTAEKRAALELWASQLAVAIAQASGENITRIEQHRPQAAS